MDVTLFILRFNNKRDCWIFFSWLCWGIIDTQNFIYLKCTKECFNKHKRLMLWGQTEKSFEIFISRSRKRIESTTGANVREMTPNSAKYLVSCSSSRKAALLECCLSWCICILFWGEGDAFNIVSKGSWRQEHQGPIRLATDPPVHYLKPPSPMTLS